MKKIFNCAIAFIAMFATSFNAYADEKAVEEEEHVEIQVSEENAAKANSAEEIEEVRIYQSPDGSVYVIHTQTIHINN